MGTTVLGLCVTGTLSEMEVLRSQYSLGSYKVRIHTLPTTRQGASVEDDLQTKVVGIGQDVLVELHLVKGINESLSQQNDTNMFVTLFVGVLDLQTFTLDYCNAGHDSPAMIADGEVTMLPCDSNIPAGVMSGWEFTRQQTQMTAGSTIFLYTDGLNEAEDSSHRQFGMTRVVETAKTTENTPQQLIDSMTEAVRQFVGQAEQSDDLTMLAIKVTNKNA